MEPTIVISKQAISRDSTTSGDTIHFFAAPVSSLVHMGATYGEIVLFFKDSNHYSDNSIAGGRSTKASKYVKVFLKTRAGNEMKTIEFVKQTIDKAKSNGSNITLDNNSNFFDIRGVLKVNNIVRDDELPDNDDIYLSCGTGGTATDIDPGIIDVATDTLLFYDSSDNGLPKTTSVPDFIASIAGDNITAIDGVLSVEFPESDLPKGGDKYSVLSKRSNTDFDFEWTEDPTFESLNISKWSLAEHPELLFKRSQGFDHVNTPTEENDILGEIGFRAVNNQQEEVAVGKLKVTQTSNSISSVVQSKLELFTGTQNGEEVALTINDERVTILPNQSTTPSAVQGGLYADNNDILFFGVS